MNSRLRFSLRTLFVLVTLACIALAYPYILAICLIVLIRSLVPLALIAAFVVGFRSLRDP